MIVHAAIRCPSGKVVSGDDLAGYPTHSRPRHHDIINFLVEIMGYSAPIGSKYEQGFVTETGEFLTRMGAMNHAILYGQITRDCCVHSGKYLFSEDLW